jgi:hypothetical protein
MNPPNEQPVKAPPPSKTESLAYDYNRGRGPINQLLWWCAGADAQLLEKSPYADRAKYAGIGGAVLATGVLACLSGYNAFYTVFSTKGANAMVDMPADSNAQLIAAVVGLIWAAIIFNLDRFIVSSTGDGDGTETMTMGELGKAFPRLIMAIIIGLVMAAPLEIKVLETEINAKLEDVQADELAKRHAKTEATFKDRKAELQEQQKAIDSELKQKADFFEQRRKEVEERRVARVKEISDRRAALAEEIQGRVKAGRGSGVGGKGPAAEAIEKEIAALEIEVEEEHKAAQQSLSEEMSSFEKGDGKRLKDEREQLTTELQDLEKKKAADRETNANKIRGLDGLAERIRIADEEYPVIVWMLRIFLMMIEIAPIIFKMQLSRGAYNYLLENQQRLARARYGIDTRVLAGEDSAGQTGEKISAQMHMPETVMAEQIQRYQAEQKMAERVHQEYLSRALPDISTNLGKYVDNSTVVPPRIDRGEPA